MRMAAILPIAVCILHAAVVIDRVAVVVNRHPIKTSDIERDLRLTDFLNKAAVNFSNAEEKAAAERLIDQQLIRAEIASGGYRRATEADADKLLDQIRHDRFGNSDVRLSHALGQYGLTEDRLRAQLLWQLTVLRFISDRFSPGVTVTDGEVRNYYDAHRAEFHTPLSSAAASIRKSLDGEQVNQALDTWLADQRKEADIEYKVDYGREPAQ